MADRKKMITKSPPLQWNTRATRRTVLDGDVVHVIYTSRCGRYRVVKFRILLGPADPIPPGYRAEIHDGLGWYTLVRRPRRTLAAGRRTCEEHARRFSR
jgi:hypothetical protein